MKGNVINCDSKKLRPVKKEPAEEPAIERVDDLAFGTKLILESLGEGEAIYVAVFFCIRFTKLSRHRISFVSVFAGMYLG